MFVLGETPGDYFVAREWPAHPGASAVLNVDLPDTIPSDLCVDEIALEIDVELGAAAASLQIDSKAELDALINTIVSQVNIETSVYKTIIPQGMTLAVLRDLQRAMWGVEVQIFDENGDELVLGSATFGVTANLAKLRLHVPVIRFSDIRGGRHPMGAFVGTPQLGRLFAPYYEGLRGLTGGTVSIRFGSMAAVSLGGTSWTPTAARTAINLVFYGEVDPADGAGNIRHVSPIRPYLPRGRGDDLIRLESDALTLCAYRTDLTVEAILDAVQNIGGAPDMSSAAQRIDLSSTRPAVGRFDNGSAPAKQDWALRHNAIMRTHNSNSGDYLRRFYAASTGDRSGPLLSNVYGPSLIPSPVALGRSYIATGVPQTVGQSQGSIVRTGSSTVYYLAVRPLDEMDASPRARAANGGPLIAPPGLSPGQVEVLKRFLPTRPA